MARRRKSADPFADMAKKMEVLERELAAQSDALDRLKKMGTPSRVVRMADAAAAAAARKSA